MVLGRRRQIVKVLIACEFSGIVRDAFVALGHDAWSCDLLPSERPGNHLQTDFRAIELRNYDMLIAHPPCTHLAVSGARWFKDKPEEQKAAISFFMDCANAPIERIAIENPVCIMSRLYRKPDQIIQPWMFGHPETKATCLWFKNLPKLEPTSDVHEQMMQLNTAKRSRVHYASPGPDRWKERSRTLPGIASAMAAQWGYL
jgi:hypothetical protein